MLQHKCITNTFMIMQGIFPKWNMDLEHIYTVLANLASKWYTICQIFHVYKYSRATYRLPADSLKFFLPIASAVMICQKFSLFPCMVNEKHQLRDIFHHHK